MLAERVGFEPTNLAVTSFPGPRTRPNYATSPCKRFAVKYDSTACELLQVRPSVSVKQAAQFLPALAVLPAGDNIRTQSLSNFRICIGLTHLVRPYISPV